jgi:hypothetical protein
VFPRQAKLNRILSLVGFAKSVSKILFTLTFLILPLAANSQDSTSLLPEAKFIEYQQSEKRNLVNLGLSIASIQLANGSLQGFGPTLGFEYLVLPNWSIYPSLTLALDVSSQSYLYSGFNGTLRYSLFGSAVEKTDTIIQNKWPVVRTQTVKSQRMTANFGIEQLFLNGTRAVYPATGLSLGASYMTPLFGAWTEWTIRGASLNASGQSATAIFLESIINLDF